MDLQTFEKQWLAAFASNISEQALEKYVVHTGNYIWHVFSWELLPAEAFLQGDAARAAYDAVSKDGAICIEPFSRDDVNTLPAEFASAAALDQRTEVYAAAADFSWSYIKTHENDACGPYFITAKNEKE